jgi:hypothetical protein
MAGVACAPVFATTQDSFTAKDFPTEIDCKANPANDNSGAALDAAMARHNLRPSMADLAFAHSTLAAVAPFDKVPDSGDAQRLAMRTLTLTRVGLIIAAQISQDDAMATSADYRQSQFSRAIQSFLNTLVTPDEDDEGDTPSTAGTLAAASSQMKHRLRQVSDVRAMLGAAYDRSLIRYYILAHSFDDIVGAQAAESAVCAMGLPSAVRTRIGVAAAYMKSKPSI